MKKGFTPHHSVQGFTLIELLISTTIILGLILISIPAFDRIKNRNQLQGAGGQLQNCLAQAKALALAPDSAGIDYYQATITLPDMCQVSRFFTDGSTDTVDDFQLPAGNYYDTLNVSIGGVPTPLNTFSFDYDPENNGQVDDSSASLPLIMLYDDNDNCLNIKFIAQTGEILLDVSGKLNNNGVCL